MTNNRKFHVTAFLLLLFVSLFATNIPNVQADQDMGFDEDQIQQLLKENKIPALGLGIIRDGKLKHVKVFGELRKGQPAPVNTVFNVASLTKPIVALLALKLVSSGKWSLDEPLDKYWIDPDLKDDPRHKKLTTRLVLTHQTGFPNWRWLTKSKKLEFVNEPGTKYQYSGEGFEYLRKALEQKFKRPIEELANDLIFKPLQMRDTRLVWDARIESRFAIGP
jgi:CubicO group peptidase (beta-lactamase class C family)